MVLHPRNSPIQQGVSIITCTNRQGYAANVFSNYSRQTHRKKELIIVVNDTKIPLSSYRRLARQHKNVTIFKFSEQNSLGACLNYAVKKTRYKYIAKFDDDDYYAPYYLRSAMMVFHKTGADIIGKRAHYMYLRGPKTLILRFAEDENRIVSPLPGATLVFKREILNKVRFPNKSVGEDDIFCRRSKSKGYKIYSADKYNFVAIRRKNSANHTWTISDKKLIDYHKEIKNVRNFKKFVRVNPKVLYKL